jgi:hypothetical protein
MTEGKNRQWMLDARPAGKLTGKEFCWNEAAIRSRPTDRYWCGTCQREGKLVQKEDVAVGLENVPRTLMRLFTGENFGKQLLKIADGIAAPGQNS